MNFSTSMQGTRAFPRSSWPVESILASALHLPRWTCRTPWSPAIRIYSALRSESISINNRCPIITARPSHLKLFEAKNICIFVKFHLGGHEAYLHSGWIPRGRSHTQRSMWNINLVWATGQFLIFYQIFSFRVKNGFSWLWQWIQFLSVKKISIPFSHFSSHLISSHLL